MYERRKHPRIDKKLALKVKAGSFELVSQTQNISLSGVCCQVNKYIEPMTKVSIILLLPIRLKNNKTVTRKVNCRGIVVRAEKHEERKDKFNIAIFFNNMRQAALNTIHRYIENHLQVNLSARPIDCISRYPSGAN